MYSCVCEHCRTPFEDKNRRRFCSHACYSASLVGKKVSVADRLFDKIAKTDTCWLWTGYVAGSGYGQLSDESGKIVYAHRLSYEFAKGVIPDGLHLDHLCRVRHCVNPDHLEPVTSAENTRRGDLSGNVWKQREKTHCKNGHEFTPENTRFKKEKYGTKIGRACKTCQRIRNARVRGKIVDANGYEVK